MKFSDKAEPRFFRRRLDRSLQTGYASFRDRDSKLASVPWSKNFDVNVARDKAKALIWLRSEEPTSMEDLLQCVDINRVGVHATFGGNHALYLHVLLAKTTTTAAEISSSSETTRHRVAWLVP